jgi:hypothetical protein
MALILSAFFKGCVQLFDSVLLQRVAVFSSEKDCRLFRKLLWRYKSMAMQKKPDIG